jgi:hypothetical protein
LKRNYLIIPILFFVFLNTQLVFPATVNFRQKAFAENFWRTELYFGRDKNDGTQVSDEEWSNFLDEFVTPRFPDGFTVLEGKGQYRLQNGSIVKENSKVLVLLYMPKTRLVNTRKINEIRNEYKKRFKQESVMRVDFRQTVNVSF